MAGGILSHNRSRCDAPFLVSKTVALWRSIYMGTKNKTKSTKLKIAAVELRRYAAACQDVMNDQFGNREELDEQVAHLNGLADDLEGYGKTAGDAVLIAQQEKLLAATGGRPMFRL